MRVLTHVSKLEERTPPRVSHSVRYGLWATWQVSAVSWMGTAVPLRWGVRQVGESVRVCAGTRGMWELSVPSAQLSWEPNTALKKSIKNHFFTRMGTYVSTPSLLPNFLKQWYPFLQLSDFDSTVQNESKRLQTPLKIQSLEGALPNPVLS